MSFFVEICCSVFFFSYFCIFKKNRNQKKL